MNIKRKENYNQVCVWPGCIVYKDGNVEEKIKEFENFMFQEFGARVQFLEQVVTLPDTDNSGCAVPGTGGRIDIFFAVHCDDVGKFSLSRLKAGIRWIEDVLSKGNYTSSIYPKRIGEYVTWNFNNIASCFDLKGPENENG